MKAEPSGLPPWFTNSASVNTAACANAFRHAAVCFADDSWVSFSPPPNEPPTPSVSKPRALCMVTVKFAPSSFFKTTASPATNRWSSTNPRQFPARQAPDESRPALHVLRQASPSHRRVTDLVVRGRKSAKPIGAATRNSPLTCLGSRIFTKAGPAGEKRRGREDPEPLVHLLLFSCPSPRRLSNESLDVSSLSHDQCVLFVAGLF
mmetsp:Transcript_5040/g.18821  ORF Transcript_5040/g.18821 Transcript_5040/m.18821 type:complete len:206 (+) Transcript_5040:937-1554(+)